MKARVPTFAFCLVLLVHCQIDLAGQEPKGTAADLKAIFNKAHALFKAGKYAEALPLFENAASLAPTIFGPDHVTTAEMLFNVGVTHYRLKQHDKAIPAFEASLKIREARGDKDSIAVARTLGDLAEAHQQLFQLDKAEPLLKRCLEITERQLGKTSPELAVRLNDLARLNQEMGRWEQAESLFVRSLRIREARDDFRDVSILLNNLGALYREMGRFREADSSSSRSLTILEDKLGKDNTELAVPLNNLGLTYQSMGRFPEAESLFLRSLRLHESVLPKDHLDLTATLNNLAVLYRKIGRYADSEALFQRSRVIRASKLGKDHPSLAIVLDNLAVLYVTLGRHKEAEALGRQVLEIRETRLGVDHPATAKALVTLAHICREQTRYAEAEELLQRAIRIGEVKLGKSHREVGAYLNSLAILYDRMDRLEEAEALHARALEMAEKQFGPGHPGVAAGLHNLGLICLRRGRYENAERFLERCIEIEERFASPRLVDAYHSMAAVAVATGQSERALKLQGKSMQLSLHTVETVFSFSSEPAMFSFLENTAGMLPSLITMCKDTSLSHGHVLGLDWTLRRKGIVLDAIRRFRQVQDHLAPDDPLRQRLAEFSGLKQLLADAALSPPKATDTVAWGEQMERWRKDLVELEAEVNRGLATKMPGVLSTGSIDTETVRKHLAANTALVEFVRCPLRNFKDLSWSSPHYFAFVLLPGDAPPQLIDLGEAKAIDKGVAALRKQFDDFQEKLKECESEDEIKALEKAQEKEFQKASASLHALVFAPLRKALGKTKLVYLAADGDLNRLPFESLVDDGGKYLVESFQFAYLSSGRDLLRPETTPAKGTVVFANPDFRLGPEERKETAAKLLEGKKTEKVLVASRGPSDTRSIGWKALPGAAAEAKDIQKLLHDGAYGPVRSFQGPEALEEMLKTLPAPRVLHLATHGFFVDHDPDARWKEGEGAGWARGRLKAMDNPLLRSGVVLAGANTVGDKAKKATPEGRVEDGWVTAEEIALLNLRGTELVVLSACQTGLGDVKSGEGVSGLRWAFLYAGARTLVTSLFEVPDTETRELMKHFYGRLESHGKLDALHGAQLTLIRERRASHGAAHPFFWASFVLVGDPK